MLIKTLMNKVERFKPFVFDPYLRADRGCPVDFLVLSFIKFLSKAVTLLQCMLLILHKIPFMTSIYKARLNHQGDEIQLKLAGRGLFQTFGQHW